jgi:FlaA1/EpsC-like NDP-sugar epimerase
MFQNKLSRIDILSSIVTSRESSYFSQDLQKQHSKIIGEVMGAKILIFGAAGFIASQTIRILLEYKPRSIVLVDINENSLTELIRDLRNRFKADDIPELFPILTDVTSDDILQIPKLHPDIDIIWNFSAVKHVRSERDPISIARMFSVNVLGMFLIVDLARKLPNLKSLFSVSTDKAANPVSFMGASKRLMELVLFSSVPALASSARFANVSFSTGSLLDSWLKRISNGEPVATPGDTLRYFISPEESGQLCLMASTVTDKNLISVPTLNPEKDLQNLDSVLFKLLNYLELEPVEFTSENTALENSLRLSEIGKQAVLITNRDTSGEKPFEEFLGRDEKLQSFLPSIHTISTGISSKDSIDMLRKDLLLIAKSKNPLKARESYLRLVSAFVPSFDHSSSKWSLDSRL